MLVVEPGCSRAYRAVLTYLALHVSILKVNDTSLAKGRTVIRTCGHSVACLLPSDRLAKMTMQTAHCQALTVDIVYYNSLER